MNVGSGCSGVGSNQTGFAWCGGAHPAPPAPATAAGAARELEAVVTLGQGVQRLGHLLVGRRQHADQIRCHLHLLNHPVPN